MLNGVIKLSRMIKLNIIGVGLVGALVAISTISAYADNITTNVNINPSLTLTIPTNSISLDLDPAATTFASQDLTVAVGTNNPAGYNLMLTSTTTDLVETTDNSKTIPTLESTTTLANFPVNHWGYKKDSSNYMPFATSIKLLENDGPANNDTTTLNFASKIDYSQPSGEYNLALNFTLTATPLVEYMQDLDASSCTTDAPLLVVDKRDEKSYTVQRLADGNCWMTSDLNLAGGTKLDSEGSNVPSGYTQTNPYYTLPASSSTGFSSDTTAYVYNTGNETTNQADCTSSQPCNSYYSWLAATAGGKNASGTAVTSNGGMTAYSVCPKGWKLPSATTDGVARDSGGYTGGDFYKMILAEKGVSSLPNGYYANPDSSPTFYTKAGPGTLADFLLAGYYYSSTFYDGGSYGFYWSSSSSSSTSAYDLYFGSSYVNSANYGNRRDGFPVRCILSGV